MQNVSERYQTSAHPIRILQFGEGNFLRAFADYAIDAANEERNFDAGIAIVMPRELLPVKRTIKNIRFLWSADSSAGLFTQLHTRYVSPSVLGCRDYVAHVCGCNNTYMLLSNA